VTALDVEPNAPSDAQDDPQPIRRRLGSVEVLTLAVLAALLARGWLVGLFSTDRSLALVTVTVSIIMPALPFLVLGTVLSAAITTFVPARFLDRALSRPPAAAVPVAGLAATILPVGEYGSVPASAALVRRGRAPSAALAFLVASPALSPVVLIATAVAFPGQPMMVGARYLASAVTAVVLGWLWLRLGRPLWLAPQRSAEPDRGWPAFWACCRHDIAQAGGFLVMGALAVAALTVTVPPGVLNAIAHQPFFSVLALALLAVLLCVCAGADAFVAASLSQFSLTARLAFLTVGSAVNLKRFALQVGAFGPQFAARFAPATFGAAILFAVLVGAVLL
jgi:uncharacterized protein